MKDNQIELYFVQFWFMKNRMMLIKDYRNLYDVLFEIYEKLYNEGKVLNQDLMTIEKVFENNFDKNFGEKFN